MSANKFLVIEIRDQELVTLFQGLREIFNGHNDHKVVSPTHITIKGPQEKNFNVTAFEEFSDSEHPLVISRSSYFSYSKKYFVHFKVQIPEMEKYQLWYKPTFPNEKNPHITVCETSDEDFSKDVVKFLNKEVEDLLCRDYEFLQYVRKQGGIVDDVSARQTRSIADASMPRLINVGKIKKGLFARAREIKAKQGMFDFENRERQPAL